MMQTKRRFHTSMLTAILLTGTLLVGGSPSLAAETIRLTALSGYPPVASWVRVFKDFYMPEVNRRLAQEGQYEIDWNEGFSGTIVKPREELEGIQTGLGDIGIVPTVFHADKVPYYNISYVTPFTTTDLGLVVRTYDQLAEKYDPIAEHWKKFNQVVLASAGVVENYVIVTNRPVKTLSDFEGMKIGAAGPNLILLRGAGVTGVNGNLTVYYNDINNGVYDGAIMWAESIANFKMAEVAPYLLDAKIGAVGSFAVTVNQETWTRLPDAVRSVLATVAEAYRDRLAEEIHQEASPSLEKYKAMGGTITEMSETDREQWAASLPNIAREWVEGMNAEGLPGSQILNDYMQVMRDNAQPIARQWDE